MHGTLCFAQRERVKNIVAGEVPGVIAGGVANSPWWPKKDEHMFLAVGAVVVCGDDEEERLPGMSFNHD